MFLAEKVISIVAPHCCLVCGSEGSLLCSWCMPDVLSPIPSRCYRCAKITTDSAVCSSCRRYSPLRHVWIAGEYDGLAKQLVYCLKFHNAKAAVQPMVQAMLVTLPYLPPNTLVVPIPTATSRRRQRGYDQAELLAKALSKQLKLPYASLLARSGQTRQVGTKRADRLAQLESSYRPIKPYLINESPILLVDDVVTTGATIEAAAKVLKQVGAKTVNAALFAQKQ